jgi:NADH dehydrogenase FAD-containing subunit
VELVVVSPQALAPYSGMVPGWLAGSYNYQDIAIDFPSLCAQAGARWVAASIERLDPDAACLYLDTGDSLHYDTLSLNIGSTLTPPRGEFAARVLSLRPLSRLQREYDALLELWALVSEKGPFHVTAVGAGAAGFESLLAVLRRLRGLRPDRPVFGRLIGRGAQLLPGYPAGARRQALRALESAGVTLSLNTDWSDALGQETDLVLWATGAEAHAWQRCSQGRGALQTSPEGFVQIDSELRSVSHPQVFAVGDCAQWRTPLPKAGVYAVRMGPVLAHNLRAALTGQALQGFWPQQRFLSLLSTADGRAIGVRGGLSLSGRWAWRWKDHIDRSFIRRFASPFHQPGATHTGTS